MNAKNSACDATLIERYFDGEVSRDEQARIGTHLAGCASCRRLLAGNREIGRLLRSQPDHCLGPIEKTVLKDRLVEQLRKRRRGAERDRLGLSNPRRWVPAAAVIGMLLAAFIFFSGPDPGAGPSAIVTSFQGDYSSVMIVETPETRSTIIWFDETS
jgi:anti-sigma factor RsiW